MNEPTKTHPSPAMGDTWTHIRTGIIYALRERHPTSWGWNIEAKTTTGSECLLSSEDFASGAYELLCRATPQKGDVYRYASVDQILEEHANDFGSYGGWSAVGTSWYIPDAAFESGDAILVSRPAPVRDNQKPTVAAAPGFCSMAEVETRIEASLGATVLCEGVCGLLIAIRDLRMSACFNICIPCLTSAEWPVELRRRKADPSSAGYVPGFCATCNAVVVSGLGPIDTEAEMERHNLRTHCMLPTQPRCLGPRLCNYGHVDECPMSPKITKPRLGCGTKPHGGAHAPGGGCCPGLDKTEPQRLACCYVVAGGCEGTVLLRQVRLGTRASVQRSMCERHMQIDEAAIHQATPFTPPTTTPAPRPMRYPPGQVPWDFDMPDADGR